VVPTLRCSGEPLNSLNANDCRDCRHLKAAPGLAEILLHGVYIERPGNLVGCGDAELAAGDLCETAPLKFVLEGFALCFGALQQSVGMAELVGKRVVRQIVKAGCGKGFGSLSHWSLLWLGLGLSGCFQHLGGPTIL